MPSDLVSAREFKSVLNRLIWLPVGGLLVLAAALGYQIARLRASANWVDHTDVVIATANDVLRLMVDEETGMRGYLLNGSREFLEPYSSGRQQIPMKFRELEQLIGDNPAQIVRLREIETAHANWESYVEVLLESPTPVSSRLNEVREAKWRMDVIRKRTSEFLQVEAALRRQRSTLATFLSGLTLWELALLAAIVAVVISLYTRHAVTQLTRRFQAIHTQLEASEKQFRELADSIPQLAWMADAGGHVFWYNRRWYEYTGTTEKEMTGWGWRAVHDQKRLPEVEKLWQQSLRAGTSFEMVFPLRGADDVFRPFLTRVLPVRDEKNRVVRWFGTNTDISAERAAIEALRVSQETLRVALDASNTGTFRWDAGPGRFLEVGPNFRRLFGLLPSEEFASTEDLLRIVQPEDLSTLRAALGEAAERGEIDVEYRVVHPDGSIHWLYQRAKREQAQSGTCFVGACTDITQRKLAEDTLRRTEKLALVGRLASSISHEINNPIAAVTNLLYLANNATSLDAVREYTSLAQTELARVSQIATQTLGLNRSPAPPKEVNIPQLLESALSVLGPNLREAGIGVERQYEGGFVCASEGELRQVFLNLIGNALDATRGVGTRIIVRERSVTDPKHGQKLVRVTVADTGHGMDPTTAAHIFEPFFSTKGESGTGLGLWITHDIVQKHSGTIRVRSAQCPKAHGTVFSVFLPLNGTGLDSNSQAEKRQTEAV